MSLSLKLHESQAFGMLSPPEAEPQADGWEQDRTHQVSPWSDVPLEPLTPD